MELRIVGNEQELATFIMLLGKTNLPSVKAEIKSDAPKVISKMDMTEKKVSNKGIRRTVTTTEVAKKYGVTGQTIRNYVKFGMPCDNKKNKKLFNLAEVEEWITDYQSKHNATHNRGKKYTTKRSKSVKVERSEYSKWASEFTQMCREKGKEKGKELSKAYIIMTNNYGIVWDQLRKEFYADNGYKANSTLELAYYLEQKNKACKNLLKGVLSNVLDGKY